MLVKRDAREIKKVLLTDCKLSLEEFVAVARYGAEVDFSAEYEARVRRSRDSLEKALADGRGIYGVNTGFGDNVRFRIAEDEMKLLQKNIVLSHATAMGKPLEKDEVRGMFLMLLLNIGKGYSAVRMEVMEKIRCFLNEDLYPYAPSEGSIGALSVPAYASMTLIGAGRFVENGKLRPAEEVLKERGIEPLVLHSREGLGILTNASEGIACSLLGLYDYIMLLRHADLCGALVCEALQSTDKAFDIRLVELKGHEEQLETARYLNKLLAGSEIMEKSRDRHVQDSTNTRMLPYIHGAVKRICAEAYQAFMEEFHGVNDNPVFLPEGLAMMGANWDATYTTLHCDAVSMSVATLGKLLETHMERLVDAHLSELPPFLVKNPGLNNGFMIVQYATAGLLGDIALQSSPAGSFHAVVSASQEAPIPRDDPAALKMRSVIEKLRHMISLTLLTALQAVDFIEEKMSPINRAIHDEVRKTVSFMENDDAIYQRIEEMERIVESGKLLEVAQELAGDFTI